MNLIIIIFKTPAVVAVTLVALLALLAPSTRRHTCANMYRREQAFRAAERACHERLRMQESFKAESNSRAAARAGWDMSRAAKRSA